MMGYPDAHKYRESGDRFARILLNYLIYILKYPHITKQH